MGWQGTDPIKWAAKMKDAPRNVINGFAFEVFSRVVMRTPVDTGQARSNWLVSINENDQRTLGADIKTKKITKRKGPNAGTTVTKRSVKLERNFSDTIEQGRMAIAFAQNDDKIIIQNNLPYIRKLEYGGYGKTITKGIIFKRKKFVASNTEKTVGGFSKQAPQGMVGLVLSKADQIWDKVAKAAMGGS